MSLLKTDDMIFSFSCDLSLMHQGRPVSSNRATRGRIVNKAKRIRTLESRNSLKFQNISHRSFFIAMKFAWSILLKRSIVLKIFSIFGYAIFKVPSDRVTFGNQNLVSCTFDPAMPYEFISHGIPCSNCINFVHRMKIK